MKMNLGDTPTDNGMTTTARKPCGKSARSTPLAVLSFVLAIVAVVMLEVACNSDRWFLMGRTHWLIVGVLVPAASALVCSVVFSLTNRLKASRGGCLAQFGCTVAILCAVVVWALPGLLAQRSESIPLVCIANMRNIETAISKAAVEGGKIGIGWDTWRTWSNSAQISPILLKKPQTVCCPLSPGVPYPCFPQAIGDEPMVVCPNAGIVPGHKL